MLSHFDTYAGIRLNIVDVISMINKFLINGKLLLTFELKWREKLANPYFFRLKKLTKIFLSKLSAKNRRKGRNYFIISFLFHA